MFRLAKSASCASLALMPTIALLVRFSALRMAALLDLSKRQCRWSEDPLSAPHCHRYQTKTACYHIDIEPSALRRATHARQSLAIVINERLCRGSRNQVTLLSIESDASTSEAKPPFLGYLCFPRQYVK